MTTRLRSALAALLCAGTAACASVAAYPASAQDANHYAQKTYTTAGGTLNYAIPFPFQQPSDILVTLDGAPITAPFTVVPGMLTLGAYPGDGHTLLIVRSTYVYVPKAFFSGGPLASADLNLNAIQSVYGIQEDRDGNSNTASLASGIASQAAAAQVTAAAAQVTANSANSAANVALASLGNASLLSTGTLPPGRLPAFSGGDVSGTAGFNTLTLNTVLGSPGSCGDATHAPAVTVNGKGLVTALACNTISSGASYGAGTGIALTGQNFSVLYGTSSGTAVAGNDTRITGAAQLAATNTWPQQQNFGLFTSSAVPTLYHSTIIGQGAPVNSSMDLVANSPAASGGVRNFFANIGYTVNDSSSTGGDSVGLYTAEEVKQLNNGQAAPANFLAQLDPGSGSYLSTTVEIDTANNNKVMDCSVSGAVNCVVGLRVTGQSQYLSGGAIEINGAVGSGPMWRYGLAIAGTRDQALWVLDNSASALLVTGSHTQQIDLQGTGSYALRVRPSAGADTLYVTPNGNLTINNTSGNGIDLGPQTTTGTPNFAFHSSGHSTADVTLQSVGGSSTINAGSFIINATETVSTNLRPLTDNAYNLGLGSFRYANVYAANGTIQTSDARLKKEVEVDMDKLGRALKDTPMHAYVWKDGSDGGRIRFGVYAQELAQALYREGLDWRKFSFLQYDAASDTWGVNYADLENAKEMLRQLGAMQ